MQNKIIVFGLIFFLGLTLAEGWLDFLFGPPNATVEQPASNDINALASDGQSEMLSSNGLGQIITILNSMLAKVQAIEENTKAAPEVVATGNIVLFDNNGNYNYKKNQGNHIIALPSGKCEIAVFAEPKIDVELSEMNTFGDRRSEQKCADEWVCRKRVTIDKDYPFLKLFWVETDSSTSDTSRATLAYRCVAKESMMISSAENQNAQ